MTNDKSQEGKVTVAVEKKTSKIPSMVYLRGRKSAALLVGQWAAPLLIMGLYNKIVKTEGHDRPESGTDKLNRII